MKCVGNKGPKIKNDCYIELSLDQKENSIEIESNQSVLSEDELCLYCETLLDFFELDNYKVTIEDKGAPAFVFTARMEAVIKKHIDSSDEFLSDFLFENHSPTFFDANRFTRLYLPGNMPRLMLKAADCEANGLILDLEDAVAPEKKFEARYLVRNALRSLEVQGKERMVRINQGEMGLKDLDFIVPHYVNLILVPKCESAKEIQAINTRISEIMSLYMMEHDIWLMPIIESALGVEKAFEIATAADNVVALAIGLEDYTADIGTQRTAAGEESLYARMRIVNAAHAASIQPIDSVFSEINDMDAVLANAVKSKALGFVGMGCIHPKQISIIFNAFLPSEKEIEYAKKVIKAFLEASEKGLGVVALGSKMIDPPVVKRAEKTIELAVTSGLIPEDWIN